VGLSLRAAEIVRQNARRRLAERLERERRESAEAAAFHRDFLDRDRAAAHIGVSLATLRRMMTAGTSPAYVKTLGDHKQSPVLFPRDELDAWLADRDGYSALRPGRMAALAAARDDA
jgi:hypothetical protein